MGTSVVMTGSLQAKALSPFPITDPEHPDACFELAGARVAFSLCGGHVVPKAGFGGQNDDDVGLLQEIMRGERESDFITEKGQNGRSSLHEKNAPCARYEIRLREGLNRPLNDRCQLDLVADLNGVALDQDGGVDEIGAGR